MDVVVTPDFRLKMREWRKKVQKELLRDGAELVRQQTRQRIRTTKTAPDGTPWPDRPYGNHPLLVETGKLLGSIRKRRRNANSYAVGTDVPYARKHQEGLGVRKRQYLGLSDDDAREMEELVDTFVELRFR